MPAQYENVLKYSKTSGKWHESNSLHANDINCYSVFRIVKQQYSRYHMIEAAERGPKTLLDYDRIMAQIGVQRVSSLLMTPNFNENVYLQ